ncbi:MAG TPA: YajQ family cyclic di-GMP-binding protein [bacterium]|nr:YajQ family cyclic di-GMP-binding protein [bacterium]
MAKDSSFDIVSKVDLQEVLNGVDQALREIVNRYDFKDSGTTIELNKEEREITINTADDYKARAAKDVLLNKMVKRGVPLKALSNDEPEASGQRMLLKIKIQDGIPQEKAKDVVKYIKELGLKKIQASIQKDVVRVSGPKKDDLQEVMAALKAKDFGIDIQFDNYR